MASVFPESGWTASHDLADAGAGDLHRIICRSQPGLATWTDGTFQRSALIRGRSALLAAAAWLDCLIGNGRLVALFPPEAAWRKTPIPVIRLVRRHARKLPLVHVPQTTCLMTGGPAAFATKLSGKRNGRLVHQDGVNGNSFRPGCSRPPNLWTLDIKRKVAESLQAKRSRGL